MSLLGLLVAMNDGYQREQERVARRRKPAPREVTYQRTKNSCCVAVVDGMKKADANYATLAELRSLGIEYREAVKIIEHRPYDSVDELIEECSKRECVRTRYAQIFYVGEIVVPASRL